VVDLNAALSEEFFDVAKGQAETQVPADRQHDHIRREAEASEGRSWDGNRARAAGSHDDSLPTQGPLAADATAPTETPTYLRPAEVADLLSVSPKTVSRWAKEGKLPFMKTLGGHRRYPEAEIRELVDDLRQEPTA
jgi:excisionase family DNA binding protein